MPACFCLAGSARGHGVRVTLDVAGRGRADDGDAFIYSYGEHTEVQIVMAAAAQQDQISAVGGSAVTPVVDVVGFTKSWGPSAADAAAVAGDQGLPLGGAGAAPAAAGRGGSLFQCG